MEQWGASNKIVIETIKVTKEYLDAELAKYETWEDLDNGFIRQTGIDSAGAFRNIKRDGIGQTTILKFLGGPWKQFQIQDALANHQFGTCD